MPDWLMSEGRGPDLVRILLYISCFTSAVATVTLVAFFWVGQPWGTYNDLTYGVFAILLLPLPPGLRRVFGPDESKLAQLSFGLGLFCLAGLAGTSLLLTSAEVGLLSLSSGLLGLLVLQGVFFLLFESWLVLIGFTIKQAGIVNSIGMSLTAVTIVGYPAWAIWLAGKVAAWRQPASPRLTPRSVG
jgi:hypothetical protein